MSARQWSHRTVQPIRLLIFLVLAGLLTFGFTLQIRAASDADICKGPDEWPLEPDKLARFVATACNNLILKRNGNREQLAEAYNKLSIATGLLGLNKGSVDMMSNAIKLNPRSSVYFSNRASIILEIDDDADRALVDAQTAGRMDPTLVRPLVIAGRAESRLDKDDEALSYFEQAVSVNNRSPIPTLEMGDFYLKNGHLRKALAQFIRSEDLANRREWGDEGHEWALTYNTRSITGQCRVLAALRDDRADSICSKALRLEPKSARANFGKGLIYLSKRDEDNALRYFDAARLADPYFAEAIVARGTVFERKGDFVRARAEYERAVVRRPRQAWGYIARAGLFREQGKYDEAKQDLMKAVEVQPRLPQAHIAMATYHQKRNEAAEAIASYERVLALDPLNSEAASALAAISAR